MKSTETLTDAIKKEEPQARKKLRFHNYIPRSEELKIYYEQREDPDAPLQAITDAQNEMIKSASRKFGDPELQLNHMAPKKGNWDMKLSLKPKLDRLEARTRRAIVEIVRQKQQEEGKLPQAVDDVQSVSSDDV